MRPYLLGMNNPQSADPRMALYPHNATVAGHRLWTMVNAINDISVEDWLAKTQRNNLLHVTELPKDYNRTLTAKGAWLRQHVQDRVVVLLGNEVANAMGHDQPPFVWGGPGGSWVLIPHPSGRNLFYNDPVNRLAVGILLADVLRVCE